MNLHHRNALKSLLERALKAIDFIPIERNCSTCLNYSPPHCKIVQAIPPAEILEKGCEKYSEDINSPPF